MTELVPLSHQNTPSTESYISTYSERGVGGRREDGSPMEYTPQPGPGHRSPPPPPRGHTSGEWMSGGADSVVSSSSEEFGRMLASSGASSFDLHTSPPGRRLSHNERCKVCGDEATGMYFGAIVCVPCKTFFLRYAGDNFSFVCKYNRECEITVASRTQCKYCRYQKCLDAGMCRRERPAQIQISDGQQLCVVCSDLANGVHFGAITCEGCKKFFRRGLQEHSTYTCKGQQECLINPRTRNSCRYCRYQKCRDAGMSREAIQMGRPAKTRPMSSGMKVKMSMGRMDAQHKSPPTPNTPVKSYPTKQRYDMSFPYTPRPPGPETDILTRDRDIHALFSQDEHKTGALSEDFYADMSTNPGAVKSEGDQSILCTRKQSRLRAIISEILTFEENADSSVPPNIKQEPTFLPEFSEISALNTPFSLSKPDSYVSRLTEPMMDQSVPFLPADVPPVMAPNTTPQLHSNTPQTSLVQPESWGTADKLSPSGKPANSVILTTDLLQDNPLEQISRSIEESPSDPATPVSSADSSMEVVEAPSKKPRSRPSHATLLSSLIKLANQLPMLKGYTQMSPSAAGEGEDSCSGGKSNGNSRHCWLHLDFKQCRSYWHESPLPDENIMFETKHQTLIDQTVHAYMRFVTTGTSINKQLRKQLEVWSEKLNIDKEAAKALLPRWINDKVVPVFTLTSFTYCLDLPGFVELDQTDQATLIRLGQSQSRILVAAVHWFNNDEKDFKDFLAWRTMQAGQEDNFKRKLVQYATSVSTLQIDTIEAALLNTLVVTATDYPGLINPGLIEDKRAFILSAFRAYTTAKLGTPNSRIEDLFKIVPELRELGLLHHRMTVCNQQGLSLP